jgi:fermentation-respiration switch protein FrsA (DUF1100 family)
VVHVGLMENAEKLGECTMPTLVLHGGSDTLVPPAQAVEAHAASGAGSRRTLKIIEGAGHNDIGMSEEYWSSIAAFLDVAVG